MLSFAFCATIKERGEDMNFDFLITDIHRVIMVGKEEYPEQTTVFKSRRLVYNELIFHVSGTAKVVFNGKELYTAPGTVRFLPSGECSEYRVERMDMGDCIDVLFSTDRLIADEAFVLDLSKRESIAPLFKKLFCAFVAKDEGYRFECISLLYKILAELQKTTYIPESRFKFLKPALDIIQRDFLQADIRTASLAAAAGISESYLKRLFSERFGVPPKKYIIQMKLRHAAELLRLERYTVTQVAHLCNFSDVYFFSRQFKEYMGLTPTQFVKKYRSSK